MSLNSWRQEFYEDPLEGFLPKNIDRHNLHWCGIQLRNEDDMSYSYKFGEEPIIWDDYPGLLETKDPTPWLPSYRLFTNRNFPKELLLWHEGISFLIIDHAGKRTNKEISFDVTEQPKNYKELICR